MESKQYSQKGQPNKDQVDPQILLKTQQSNQIQAFPTILLVPQQLNKVPSQPIILFTSHVQIEPSILLTPQQSHQTPIQRRAHKLSDKIQLNPRLLLVPSQYNEIQVEPFASFPPQQSQTSIPSNFKKLVSTTKLYFLYGSCLKNYEGAETGIKTPGFGIPKQLQDDVDNLIPINAVLLTTHLPKVLSKATYKWNKQSGCILEVAVREEARIIIINDALSRAQIQRINQGVYHVDAFYIDHILIQDSNGESKPFNCNALIVINRQIIESTTLLTSVKASLQLRRKNQVLQKIGSEVKSRIAKTQAYLNSI